MKSKEVIKARDLLNAIPGYARVAPAPDGEFMILHTSPAGTETELHKKSEVIELIQNTPAKTEPPTNGQAEPPDPTEEPAREGTADGYDDGDPAARTERPPSP